MCVQKKERDGYEISVALYRLLGVNRCTITSVYVADFWEISACWFYFSLLMCVFLFPPCCWRFVCGFRGIAFCNSFSLYVSLASSWQLFSTQSVSCDFSFLKTGYEKWYNNFEKCFFWKCMSATLKRKKLAKQLLAGYTDHSLKGIVHLKITIVLKFCSL